jgi:hypothetical protein
LVIILSFFAIRFSVFLISFCTFISFFSSGVRCGTVGTVPLDPSSLSPWASPPAYDNSISFRSSSA